jgi:hypothetical protein
VGLFRVTHELEGGSYQGSERAPLARRQVCWIYLPAAFIFRQRSATPVMFVRNERAGAFYDRSSEGL